MSPGVRELLHDAEIAGLRGDTDRAQALLVEGAAGLPVRPAHDGDRVAIGELSTAIRSWSSEVAEGSAFLDRLIDEVSTPRARGALLFHRGRGSTAGEGGRFLTQALDEFTIAGDDRGRAVALGQMSWPTVSMLGAEHRLRVGQEGLALARSLDDPWAIAFCAGRLAGAEAYLGMVEALDHWRLATMALPASTDPFTAEIGAVNQYNWGLTLLGHGEYGDAVRVLGEGRSLAHGAGWGARYDEALALVAWRSGDAAVARRLAESALARPGRGASAIAAVVLSALDLETQRQPTTAGVDRAIPRLQFDHQMRWLAQSVQGMIRRARREPTPFRDLTAALQQAGRLDIRMGWEDLLLTIALHDPRLAEDWLDRVAELWPGYPRGVAMRQAVEGLVAGPAGVPALVSAAETFAAFPEPHTAGQLLHAAAPLAVTVAEGNVLRRRALGLFTAAGSERALACVLRDRTLHRGSATPRIPASQHGAPSAGLTPREREVAQLAAWGLTAQEIADELHISVQTARHHVLRVREKFGGVPKRKLALLLAAQGQPGPLDD